MPLTCSLLFLVLICAWLFSISCAPDFSGVLQPVYDTHLLRRHHLSFSRLYVFVSAGALVAFCSSSFMSVPHYASSCAHAVHFLLSCMFSYMLIYNRFLRTTLICGVYRQCSGSVQVLTVVVNVFLFSFFRFLKG